MLPNMKEMPKVVILLGPPGAGKGTQADILAQQAGFFHFETSKILEEELRAHDPHETIEIAGKVYRYGDERKHFDRGVLLTPALVAYLVEKKIRELAHEGKRIVFSGSPRTLFETEAYLPLFSSLFGKEAVRIVLLIIPEDISIYRNSHRRICSQCRYPVQYFPETESWTRCPKCGGELIQRGSLDTPEVIRVRLGEYKERTLPIVAFLRKNGISVRELDGNASIETVAHRIADALAL